MRNLTSLSRRSFTKLIGVGAATTVARPGFAWGGATVPRLTATVASTMVRLNSNENPYGPSPLALKAMTEAFSIVWRYPDAHADTLIDSLAKLHGVVREQIVL